MAHAGTAFQLAVSLRAARAGCAFGLGKVVVLPWVAVGFVTCELPCVHSRGRSCLFCSITRLISVSCMRMFGMNTSRSCFCFSSSNAPCSTVSANWNTLTSSLVFPFVFFRLEDSTTVRYTCSVHRLTRLMSHAYRVRQVVPRFVSA